MRPLEGKPRVQLHTSFDPAMACGLATVGVDGIEPVALADHMWKTRRVFVTPINHAEFKGIRVTPNVYTRLEEVDVFLHEMENVLMHGVSA
jgi:selenocysteine lyase/cysteine desulfurase